MRTIRDRRRRVGPSFRGLGQETPARADPVTERTPPSRSWTRFRLPLTKRPITEGHRQASQLELLFDLTFVIAIARIGSELAHSVVAGHGTQQIVPFLQVFFAIW